MAGLLTPSGRAYILRSIRESLASVQMKWLPPRFTYNFQLAGYAFHQRDEKGAVDLDLFVKAFESFPWGEQMKQREKMAGGCSPTISVVDHERNFDYWVSVMGSDRRPTFLLGAVYDTVRRDSSRFEMPKVVRWCDVRIAPSRRSVISTFRIFLAGETESLMQRLGKYKVFVHKEEWNPETGPYVN